MKKKTFIDDAGDGLEDFDDLDVWLLAVERQNWAALDKLLLRRGDPPMTVEARNRLADLLRVRRSGPGRPKTDAERQWTMITRMMLKRLEKKKMTVADAAKDVSAALAEWGWYIAAQQIKDRWKKGKR